MGEFRSLCVKEKMNELKWPAKDYIVQIARFDPSKGIPNVIDSYIKLRQLLKNQLDDDSQRENIVSRKMTPLYNRSTESNVPNPMKINQKGTSFIVAMPVWVLVAPACVAVPH